MAVISAKITVAAYCYTFRDRRVSSSVSLARIDVETTVASFYRGERIENEKSIDTRILVSQFYGYRLHERDYKNRIESNRTVVNLTR